MLRTGNAQLSKEINKSIVLNLIKAHSPISRAHVANLSGLTKTTVSALVNELLESRLILETGTGKSTGGRRPVNLHFNQNAGYAIGIDLGVNDILGILTDLKGNILRETRIPLHTHDTEKVIPMLTGLIEELETKKPDSPYGIIGIGVGVPGMIDHSGCILFAPNLNWRNVPLKDILESHFGLPVLIENEANAGAYGEKQFGAGKEARDMIYVSAGSGIGVGLILGGELFRGADGLSGEMGHMTIESEGKPCSCGSRGCWEQYASEKALLRQADNRSLKTLLNEAEEGSGTAVSVLEEAGYYLGIGIANIVNTFNPQLIIIGNRLREAERWLRDSLQQSIDKRTLAYHKRKLNVTFSDLSLYSSALGMSAFLAEQFLSRITRSS